MNKKVFDFNQFTDDIDSSQFTDDIDWSTFDKWQIFKQTVNYHKCKCCSRNIGLPSGSRGLCDGCEEDIPNHIPEEQYKEYMKELWRKK